MPARLFALLITFVFSIAANAQDKPEMVISDEAMEIHQSGMLFDGHNDLPWTMRMRANSSFDKVDISKPTQFHTDIPRLKKGGLKAQYWSVYVPAGTDLTGNALIQTLEQIDLVHKMCKRYPDVFEMAYTSDDIKRIVKSGKVASLIGVEGGHSIQNSLQALRELYDRGARYMTLTHSKTLAWADSATDEAKNNGLSPFGREVVREMNRIGMLIDLSHVSPKCMKDALAVTQAPVIYSHSSARAICDHARNVPDDVLKLVAENGGVVMVNFMSGYIVPTDELKQNKRARGSHHTVCDHIEHIIKVAGIDHVGIGSDYDGVSSLPTGLDDVSYYPNITQELLNRGYDKEQIHKILGGNALRALSGAEAVAKKLQAAKSKKSASKTLFELTISAGERPKSNAIISSFVDTQSYDGNVVTLSDGNGNRYLGQIAPPSLAQSNSENAGQKVLTFVLPELAANQTVKLVATTSGLTAYREFNWGNENPDVSELTYGERPVMNYMHEPLDESSAQRRMETYKVFHHVFSPNGRRLVTKGPGGLFPHHRGLFYGFNRISYGDKQTADTWHCKNGVFQSHLKDSNSISGPVFGRHTVEINWNGKNGKPFARETRQMTAYKINGSTMIEFNSRLTSLVGPIKLDGDPQHAGFQFRASQEVPDHSKDKTYYVRPDGKGKPGVFRNWSAKKNESEINLAHVNLPWNSLSFVIGDDRYTCCYLDHTENPKQSRYSERDYGRFGSYFEAKIDTDQPLNVRYRIWLQDGEMSVKQVEALSQDFVSPLSVSVQ